MMNATMKKQIDNCNKFLDNYRWFSVWDLNYKTVAYSRKPTKAEIAFGYGATHYRSLPLKEVIGNNGQIKKRLFAKDEAVLVLTCITLISKTQSNMMNLPSEIWYWELTIYGKEEAPNPLIFSDIKVSEFTTHRLFSNFEAARTQIGIVREKLCEKFSEIFEFTIHDLDGSKDYYHGGIMTKGERFVFLVTLKQQKARIYNQPTSDFI